MVNQKITLEQANEIKELYKNGFSSLMLAKRYQVSHHTIRRWLRKQNEIIRTQSEAGNLAYRKGRSFSHRISESAKALTIEKGYILGVMCGDGYTSLSNRSFQIALQAIDKDFVVKFANCLKLVYKITPAFSEIKVKKSNWSNKWQARICSKEVFNDIKYYGNFKTLEWTVSPEIKQSDTKIKASFLQGFFDSEGHVDISSRRVNAVSINLKGLEEIKCLLDDIGIRATIKGGYEKRFNRKRLYFINVQDRKSVELFNNLVGFSIKRKQNRLTKLVAQYKLWSHNRDDMKILSPKIVDLRNKGVTYERIAKDLNISVGTAWRHIKKEQTKVC